MPRKLRFDEPCEAIARDMVKTRGLIHCRNIAVALVCSRGGVLIAACALHKVRPISFDEAMWGKFDTSEIK